MYAKATCILVQTAATYLALRAPKSSTKAENADKVKKNSLLVASYVLFLTPLGQSILLSVSTLYLVLLHRGVIPAHLKTWQLVTTMSSVLASLLRNWAFRTLNRLFTYKMTIREGHRLVKTGPYRYLLHPSYTGLIVVMMTYVAAVGHEGLWEYVIKPSHSIPIPGALVALALVWYQVAVFLDRAGEEEAMLAKAFGQEWADHASTRWRLVPLIY